MNASSSRLFYWLFTGLLGRQLRSVDVPAHSPATSGESAASSVLYYRQPRMPCLLRLILPCVVLLLGGISPESAAGVTYYVSQSAGDDGNDGLAAVTEGAHGPWRTLERASQAYEPGDEILLKRGDVWDEEFAPQGQGTSMAPIRIAAYGEGPRPLIDRRIATEDNIALVGIRLKNIAGYEIRGIEFARCGRGVFVDYDEGVHGREYLRIEDCSFRDSLYYNCEGWYTEDIPSDGGTGPDYVFDVGVWVQTRETEDVICLSDVVVANCDFQRVACAINFWSGNEWNKFADNRHQFADVEIDHCTAEDGKNWQFVLHSTHRARIANSWVHRVGYYPERAPNGIAGSMLFRCEDITIENCEFGYVSVGDDSIDGQAFDLEGNNIRTVFRNCLFHETEGPGFLMCWRASSNVNAMNVDTLFENCVFDAHRTQPGGHVFVGDEGNTATFRGCIFYLSEGEELNATADFTFEDCQRIRKGDLPVTNPLAAVVRASSSDARHPVGRATDMDIDTAWRSESGTSAGQWLELEFAVPRQIDFLLIRENRFSAISRFAVQAWDDKSQLWRDCLQGDTIGDELPVSIVPVATTRIRLLIQRTAYGSPGIDEIAAYGE